MTLAEIITEVNARNPNGYTEETEAKVLYTFESRIFHEFTGEEKKPFSSEALNEQLYLPDRYADVYIYYLSAMLHFWNKEYEEYNNHVSAFSESLEQYRAEFGKNNKGATHRFYNLF